MHAAKPTAMPPQRRSRSYPGWALDAYQRRVAPALETLSANDATQQSWIASCGPGAGPATRWRLFPGSLYLLWIEAFAATASEDHARIAAAIECLHNASLHHDDALDSNDSRRGIATIRGTLGPSASVLAGDGLVGAALRLVGAARDLRDPGIVAQLGGAWYRMTLGQLMDEAAIWQGIARDRREEHWLSMTRAKLALGNLPAPLAALAVGRPELVDPLERLHEEFAIASQIMNDIGDLEGWAGFHVIAPCVRERGQEACQKPTIATIWRDALETSGEDVVPALHRKARREIQRLTSSALSQLDALPAQPAAVDVLRDFFARPLTEFERVAHLSPPC